MVRLENDETYRSSREKPSAFAGGLDDLARDIQLALQVVSGQLTEAANIWEMCGIESRARSPSSSGSTGTSRQPRTDPPSASMIPSMRATARLRLSPSRGRKSMAAP